MRVVAGEPTRELKHAALRTRDVVFLVLAAVSPIGAVAAPMSLGIALGNGRGMPGTYLVTGAVLICFATGYAAMSRHLTNAGAFYAYIARGLGRPAGLAAAFVALLAYSAIFWSVAGALGYYARSAFHQRLGLDWPWWAWSLMAIAAVAVLGRRQVNLSAALLGFALLVELCVIGYLDARIIVQRGLAAFSWRSFDPATVFASPGVLGIGGVGIAFACAFNSFLGFEATAVFGEESRRPERSVPRATYTAVCVIGLFYAVTSWVILGGYPAADLTSAVTGPDPSHPDPGAFLFVTNLHFVGALGTNIMQWLVVSSLFAALLALHNAVSRYYFALGRDGVLPSALARSHPRFRSPHVASGVQVTIGAGVVAVFALTHADPLLRLATTTGGLGTLGVVVLQAGVALAVVVYFRRRRERRWPTTLVLPALGGLGLAAAAGLIVHDYGTFAGARSVLFSRAYWLLVAVAAAGAGYAGWLRRRRRDVYEHVGETPVWTRADR